MYTELRSCINETTEKILNELQPIFYFLMGKHPEEAIFKEMVEFWLLTGKHISKVYIRTMTG